MLKMSHNLLRPVLSVASTPATVTRFDGADPDYVDMGNVLAFNVDDDFQIEFNVRFATPPASLATIVGKMLDSGTYRGYRVDLTSDSTIKFNIYNSLTFRAVVTSVETLSADIWHHVKVIYDGGESASGLRIFLNGVEATYVVNNDTLSGTIVALAPFNLGIRNAATLPFSGDLHTVKVSSSSFPADSTWLLQGDFEDSTGAFDGTNNGAELVDYE